jgi:hypothetical protein
MFHLGTSKSSIYRRLYLYKVVSFFFGSQVFCPYHCLQDGLGTRPLGGPNA